MSSKQEVFRPDEVEVQTIYIPPEGDEKGFFVKDEATNKLAEEMGGSWWFQLVLIGLD